MSSSIFSLFCDSCRFVNVFLDFWHTSRNYMASASGFMASASGFVAHESKYVASVSDFVSDIIIPEG